MSNLLKMSLALEDDILNKRVQAASILRAQQVQSKTDAEGAFAKLILSDATRRWQDFIIAVASDAAVQDDIALSPDNSGIYATNVTDDKIKSVVASALAQTAKRITPVEPAGE